MELDTEYYDSYDSIEVHNLMLRDEPRLNLYKEAIMSSKELFKDKIVLDVGSGTGILSLFSCKAGAKHVYAIEASKGISLLSKKIVKKNNLESKITCINEVMEKVILPVDQVDIIVSEWMGVYLVHESMLNSVIYARDKYLRKDGQGLMYPSIAYLYVCPVEAKSYVDKQLNYWNKFHDFDFEPLRRVYGELMKEKPIVEEITEDQLVSDEKIISSLDLSTLTVDDLKTLQSFNLKYSIIKNCNLQGFALWFDVIFHTDDNIVTLSTSPRTKQTHWKQTVVLLPQTIDNIEACNYLKLSQNDQLECFAVLKQSDTNIRHYVIDIGISKIDKINGTEEETNDEIEENNEIEQEEEEEEDDEEEDDHPVPCECSNLRCILIRKTLENYNNDENKEKMNEDVS
jgi:protein arginine N-methyltransferase 1